MRIGYCALGNLSTGRIGKTGNRPQSAIPFLSQWKIAYGLPGKPKAIEKVSVRIRFEQDSLESRSLDVPPTVVLLDC